MNQNNLSLESLKIKLLELERRQHSLSEELRQIKRHIFLLEQNDSFIDPKSDFEDTEVQLTPDLPTNTPQEYKKTAQGITFSPPKKTYRTGFSEKYIGENILNKIGILITIIGVGIGAKYAVDYSVLTPLLRILGGYFLGLVLLFVAWRLKKEYFNFSAVLLSGAMAILYFISFAAFAFYGILPQFAAFAIMLFLTIVTVSSAIQYKRQIIAHIGMVGAYAVPFLLSEAAGNIHILFMYMGIINLGVVWVTIKKYWRLLYHSSFVITWFITIFWFIQDFEPKEHFYFAIASFTAFFLLFYISFLVYKLKHKQVFDIENIYLILLNSFLYYALIWSAVHQFEIMTGYLGLFTLANALIHFVVGVYIYFHRLADKNLQVLIGGLALLFITIAIPVQWDGNWVTLLWLGEAVLLLSIARYRNQKIYEYLSYPLIILALVSMFHDWLLTAWSLAFQFSEAPFVAFGSIQFLANIIYLAAIGYWAYLYFAKDKPQGLYVPHFIRKALEVVLVIGVIFASYLLLRFEIHALWSQIYTNSKVLLWLDEMETISQAYYNYDFKSFKIISLILYSFAFTSVFAFLNKTQFKNHFLSIICFIFTVFWSMTFLTQGLSALAELRDSYLNDVSPQLYQASFLNIAIRYVSFAVFGFMLWSAFDMLEKISDKLYLRRIGVLGIHISLVWVLSSEMVYWLNFFEASREFGFWLSLIWAVYALFLIYVGIQRKLKYLRIAGIFLMGVTLFKLFVYDVSALDTLLRTIIMISLGLLLLVISFLYNKYGKKIDN